VSQRRCLHLGIIPLGLVWLQSSHMLQHQGRSRIADMSAGQCPLGYESNGTPNTSQPLPTYLVMARVRHATDVGCFWGRLGIIPPQDRHRTSVVDARSAGAHPCHDALLAPGFLVRCPRRPQINPAEQDRNIPLRFSRALGWIEQLRTATCDLRRDRPVTTGSRLLPFVIGQYFRTFYPLWRPPGTSRVLPPNRP
jgi:hypothetical protein